MEHYGKEIRESAEEKARQIVAEELKEPAWTLLELGRRREGDRAKVAIALRLGRETTMTVSWIAERLRMGTKTRLSHLLYWQGGRRKKSGA